MAKRRRGVEEKPAPAPPDAPAHRQHGLVAMLLCGLILAAYFNCFRCGFVQDSKPVILDDPRVRAASAHNAGEIWSKGYWYGNQDPTLYRPLTTLSYLLNYAIFGNGANPAGYHAFNLALHAGNAFLVYCLGLVVFRRKEPAAALSILWAIHPVLTESVTNIVGRADLLSCFGVLAALLCHVKAPAASGWRRWAWRVGIAAASATGIFSKESSVVLIALMPIYDVTFRKKAMRSCLPGYWFAAAPLAVYFYQRVQVLATMPAANTVWVNNPLLGDGFWNSRLTAIQVIGRYFLLLLWPSSLSSDYSYNQIPLFRGTWNHWADWSTLLALGACLAAACLAAYWFRRSRPAFFFLALFFVALLPVSNLVILIGTIMAERFLYLPAAGFIGCVVWALYATPELARMRRWILAAVCVALCARTHLRNADWESELSLWTRAVESAPASFKTHLNLAAELSLNPATLDRAIQEDRRSLAIVSGLAPEKQEVSAYINIGVHHRLKGDLLMQKESPEAMKESRFWYRQSLDILSRGVMVDRAGMEEAARANQAAGKNVRIVGTGRLYQQLGLTYLRSGQPRQAIEPLQYAVSAESDPLDLQLLSEAYSALHDQDGAAIALMEGALIYPEQKGFPPELLNLYQGWEGSACAVERTAGGLSLNLGCPLVHGHLCAAAARVREVYAVRGEAAEAEKMAVSAAQSLGCAAR